MHLYHEQTLLGTLERYFYETPWASAWLTPIDQAALARYAAICAFLAWVESIPDDLPREESDARYDRELAARGLDDHALDQYWQQWHIQMPDGELREITPPIVEADGYLTWRW